MHLLSLNTARFCVTLEINDIYIKFTCYFSCMYYILHLVILDNQIQFKYSSKISSKTDLTSFKS